MLAPMRSALSIQQTHCDMSNNDAADSAVIIDHSDHHMMKISIADDFGAANTDIAQSSTSHDCCNGNCSCAIDCDMHVSASMLTQVSSFSPNFINVPVSAALITDLIKKEFTPPLRPPLVIPG